MNDIMCDLETLDNTPTSVILSLGAVKMDLKNCVLGEELSLQLSLAGQTDMGLTIGGETVQWWMRQSNEARNAVAGTGGYSLSDALARFSFFARENPVIWGNGATFDNMILRNAYRAVGREYPAKFYNDLCFRTMKTVFKSVPAPPKDPAKRHNALEDAKNQALHLCAIMYRIRRMSDPT